MYIPPEAQQMSTVEIPQVRLGLQGATGTGKTFSGLTFPNVVVADLDNNLTAHTHRTDVHRLPFYDIEWLKNNFKDVDFKKIAFPIRDCFKKWLINEAPKLEKGQTLFLDSWTRLQDAFDQQTMLEPVLTRTGGVDEFAFWDKKIDYSREIMDRLSGLKCHVIVSFHEQDTRGPDGMLIGKTEPLMQGKFQKKLGLYFTDYFRCIAESKVDAADKKKVIGTEFKWQTKSTSEVNLKSRLDLPMFVEPNFISLSKYFQPTTPQTKTTT